MPWFLGGWMVLGCLHAPPVVHAGALLRAGAASVDITPTRFPAVVNGMFTERSANRAHDQLLAQGLVLDDQRTTLAIVVVDSLMMPRAFLDRTKELASAATGIPTSNMLISATHTHSAPAVMGCLGSDADAAYPEFLQAQIVRCITLAAKVRQPARVGWTTIAAPEFTHNRRWIYRAERMLTDPFGQRTVRANMHPGYRNGDAVGPAGPVDSELSLLAVQTLDAKPLAVVANYSMHYFGSAIVSSDYFGAFRNKLASRIGTDTPVVMMSQGTSGDLMWMDYGQPKIDRTLDNYADSLAGLAHEAYRRIAYHEQAPLAMREVELTLDRRVPDQARLQWAEKIMAGLGKRKPTTQPEIYAREQLFLHKEPTRALKLQAVRIGELGIAAIPNEVFAITGLHLKALSPLGQTFVIELANGSEGYIPPPAQHDLGGYTTWPARTAALEPQAEPKIVAALLQVLEAVSGRPRRSIDAAAGNYPSSIAKANPLAYWRFEEFDGPAAVDRLGRRPGIYEPGVAFYLEGPQEKMLATSSINRAVHFAGGRMKAAIPDLGKRYSVECWFWNGLPTNARQVTGYFFSRGQDGAREAPGDHLGIGGTHGHAGKLIFFNGNKSNQILAGKRDLPLRTWQHVVLVRDDNAVRVYLNGKLEIEGTADVTVPENCGEIFFGGRNDRFAGFEGKVDEAAVYGRALTLHEITSR